MDTEELISLLLDEGVIGDERRLTPSSQFLDRVDQLSGQFDSIPRDDLESEIGSVTAEDDPTRELAGIGQNDVRFVSIYGVLREYLPQAPAESLMDLAISLYFATGEEVKSDGSPEQFIPIDSRQLELILELFPALILYIWRDDCDPCDTMRQEFDEIFTEQPEDLALFSLYGPESATMLEDRFNVVGGPTTLFIHRAKVFSRLVGAQYQSRIRAEVEALRERGATD